MNLKPNAFLAAIRSGKPQIGIWVSLCHAGAAEVIAGAGFDWAVLDMEHAPTSLGDVMHQLQVFAGYATTPMVRPDWNDPVKVKRLLDLGAPALLFPMVQSEQEARAAVAACRYPPNGIRGFAGGTRANGYGRISDYLDRVEAETAIILQVESRQALADAVAIGTVEGVDGVFFGPADIAADLGLPGQPMAPAVWDGIRPAAAALMAAGVPVGTLVQDVTFARSLLADGFTFVACGIDATLLARASDNLLAGMRAP
ncbi:4-hydroxy-2-oxo-heptane-1,7-dioate aldolase [Loktanella sp. TSTF-M6]|uniref:4-hydroxy-2-oxo-heptane-1,7-dioate aldolase n=1 Tax=Loktanella gaetbuli TaxID=2881335 RepID=A0ABS8BQC3_9RHOB|nr:aldolase/citrate lyase family protein [Loktanella gaetbuli]MCB5197691.1 4-hydroxy-2-oxo-heptane-1,7-dioate aldolase [Loktanella gaetbuli]